MDNITVGIYVISDIATVILWCLVNLSIDSTFPHEKHIKDIEISVYFKNTISYLT